MNNKYLKTILQKRAEEIAPSSEIDLWPSIQKHFISSHAVLPTYEGGSKMKGITQSIKVIVPIVLALFLGAIIVSFTPQGRALAQRLFQFFTFTEGEVILQPTAHIVLYEVTPDAPIPTPTVHPDEVLAFIETCGEYLTPKCSYSQVREMVHFPLKQLSEIPQGFAFLGATGGPQGVALIYERSNDGVRLFLFTEPWSEERTALSPVPPTTEIESVQIGKSTGEYVKGSWFTDAGPIATWDPGSGLQTLRWRDGDVLYTLNISGQPENETGLDKEWLVNLVQNLTTDPVEITSVQPDAKHLDPTDMRDVIDLDKLSDTKDRVSFVVNELPWLPEGYIFNSVSVSTSENAICMHFRHSSSIDKNSSLHLFESPTIPLPEISELAKPTDQFTKIETLTIGGAETGDGLFARANMFAFDNLCGLEGGYLEGLLWSADGMNYIIFASMVDPVTWMPSRLQLVRMAEGVTGIHTVSDETIDPDRLRSVDEAETLGGFDLVEPTMLPAGENFTYGTYSVEGNKRLVTLNYTNFGITQISGVTQTLEASYQPELAVDEVVRVNGQTAYYRQGCREASGWNKNCFGSFALVWQENGIEYRMWGVMSYEMTQEVILGIAESLR